MEAARAIYWIKPRSFALDSTNAPLFQWFTDSQVNTYYNTLDRQVENGCAEQTALLYDSTISGAKKKSLIVVLFQTAQMASTLSANVIIQGDRVIIYMPMISETIVAMLACASIGQSTRWFLVDLQPINWRCVLMMPFPRLSSRPLAALSQIA